MGGGRYVFGYGSLINGESLARALGRPVAPAEVASGWLRGYRRVFGSPETVAADARPGVATRAWFLDLAPAAGAYVNGVLVPVSDDELAGLRVRERAYACI